jgi:hypothetical protein
MILILFPLPTEHNAGPSGQGYSYNAVGPISALGFKSPTLAQLMARFGTTDPTLSSLAADRRQGLSLIAPPNAKRRRTIKKVLVEVKKFSFLITGLFCFRYIISCAFSD